MLAFKSVTYRASKHSIKRVIERFPGITRNHAEGMLEAMAYEAALLIQFGQYRYLRYADFFIPCVLEDKHKHLYKIVSLLTWDMIERKNGKGLQLEIDKYAKRALDFD